MKVRPGAQMAVRAVLYVRVPGGLPDQVMEQLAVKLRTKPKKAEGEAKTEGSDGA